jgi:deferrochelatase/peroxidase EfeB
MSDRLDSRARATRRGFLTRAAGLAAIAGSALGADPHTSAFAAGDDKAFPETDEQIEPFWGKHQGGIATPAQAHTYFTALDLVTTNRDDVVRILQAWTAAAARLARGLPIEPFEKTEVAYAYDTTTVTMVTTSDKPAPTVVSLPDTGEVQGLAAARLTVTFGFGAGLFEKDGKDRYGLAKYRPEALVDLPHFAGDELVPDHAGGDLSIQACADDPQIAFHAVRQLVRLADEIAQVRWAQTGFMPNFGTTQTPRNLMGFKDGTNSPWLREPAIMRKFVWVGHEGPDWMRDGSYVVVRRIRIALEHWDRSTIDFQEQTVGRHKESGAPIGKKDENDPLDLERADKDGNLVIAENAHVRLAAAATNDGAQIFRRPYSYNDGLKRQGMEYDAGLFFLCYQRDPRTGFIKIFENMAKFDMMNQFVTHVGSGLFACPGGVAQGEFIGQRLFTGA